MSPPHGLLPGWVGALLVVAAAAGLAAAGYRFSGRRLRAAWLAVATELGGELEEGGRGQMIVRGRYKGFAAFLRKAVSYEDAVAYPHTRGALNVKNPAHVVLGLRHKSLLEEATTRKDARPVETGDGDFDRLFFLLLTTPEHVALLLPSDVRATLRRFGDVEVYVRSGQVEWRRSGTSRSAAEMLSLFEAIAEIARAIESLPPRELGLNQKLAEEALLQHGV